MDAAPTNPSSAVARRVVVIGGSAGGVEALRVVLAQLPATFPLPIVAVMHLAAGSVTHWPRVFSSCPLPIREAEDKDRLEPATVTLAPPDYHLLVDRQARLALSTDAPVMFSRPSIDVLFQSAAWAYGGAVLGIVLSGANADGAEGLRAIRMAGGGCWVQSPASATAGFMPSAALGVVPDARILTPAEIGEALAAAGGASGAKVTETSEDEGSHE